MLYINSSVITADKICEKVLRLQVENDFNNQSESRKDLFLVENSCNKTVINFNFGRHEDLSTLKSDINLATSVSYHFFR